jgi:hypothetical protein
VLKDLFKCNILNYGLLESKIEGLITKVEKVKLPNDTESSSNKKYSVQFEDLSLLPKKADKIEKPIGCSIEVKGMHIHEKIVKRKFFIKETTLSLFKF